MSKKSRGLSFDDKKLAIVQGMSESSTIYNYHEIEVLAKKKGVITQSLKEVVETLVSEGLVTVEKIGTQNIYWSFPSHRKAQILSNIEKIRCDLKIAKKSFEEIQDAHKSALKHLSLSDAERSSMDKQTSDLLIEEKSLKNTLLLMARMDPRKKQEELSRLRNIKCECEEWTNYVFILRQEFIDKFKCTAAVLNEQFGIPSSFDFL